MYDSSHSEYARVGNHSNMILIVRFHSNRTHTPHGSVELAHSRPFSTSTLTYVFELLSAVSKDPDPLARDVRNDGPLRAIRPGCCDNYFDTQSPIYRKGTTFSDHRGILYPPGSSALKKNITLSPIKGMSTMETELVNPKRIAGLAPL